MDSTAWIALAIFMVVYVFIVSEKIHRTVIALTGAMLMIVCGTFNCLVILKVSGTVNNTVVTLSKNAEHIAVKKDNATNNFSGSAFTFLADQTAR